MIWLLYARRAILSTFKAALAYPWQAALIVAVSACVWLYTGKQKAYDTIAKRDAEIAMLEQASKIATAAQIALNNQVTNKQTEIARLIDENETSRRDIADRSRAYAGRMSTQGYCRKANPTSEGASPEGGNEPSADAVVVTRSDFDILTGNTARLVDVKAWADRLIAEGLAVPVK